MPTWPTPSAADGIDILIDLAGHTGRNRLATFGAQARAGPGNVDRLPRHHGTAIAMDYLT
jgi:predicted O-linked N-acetylglucosamine transferase (SPINDLY family)